VTLSRGAYKQKIKLSTPNENVTLFVPNENVTFNRSKALVSGCKKWGLYPTSSRRETTLLFSLSLS
jgi:hypothetical protein